MAGIFLWRLTARWEVQRGAQARCNLFIRFLRIRVGERKHLTQGIRLQSQWYLNLRNRLNNWVYNYPRLFILVFWLMFVLIALQVVSEKGLELKRWDLPTFPVGICLSLTGIKWLEKGKMIRFLKRNNLVVKVSFAAGLGITVGLIKTFVLMLEVLLFKSMSQLEIGIVKSILQGALSALSGTLGGLVVGLNVGLTAGFIAGMMEVLTPELVVWLMSGQLIDPMQCLLRDSLRPGDLCSCVNLLSDPM